jgi:hypothetical protein
MFSVDPTDAPIDWLDSNHVICVYCSAVVEVSDRIRSGHLRVTSSSSGRSTRTSKFSVGDSHGKFVVEEELEVGL